MISLNNYSKKQLQAMILSETTTSVKNHEDVVNRLRNSLHNWEQEHFFIIFLSNSGKILYQEALFKGGASSCNVDITVIFKSFYRFPKANKMIIAHNHPSGNLEVSNEDKKITEKIKTACEILCIKLLDSIIFTETKSKSILAEE